MDAAIRRQQAREQRRLNPVTFAPVNWQPQVHVTFTRDITGWLDRDRRIKWHFKTGQQAMVDEQHAIEFIVKGYATGQLPRPVSPDEQAELRSVMTTIGLGQTPQSRNGG